MAFNGCARKLSGLLKLPNRCIKQVHFSSQPSFAGKKKSLIILILSYLGSYLMSWLINFIVSAESSLLCVHLWYYILLLLSDEIVGKFLKKKPLWAKGEKNLACLEARSNARIQDVKLHSRV